jgi:membrane-bound lytic murein transglycosylase A
MHIEDIPGWLDDDVTQAWPAFVAGCRTLRNKPEWRSACAAASSVNASSRWAVRKFLADHFQAWRVRNSDGSTQGLITGYYEPVLEGSRVPTSRFTVPLHAPPDDLLVIEMGDLLPELKDAQARGARLRARTGTTPEGKAAVLPYYTRAELQADPRPLAGKALVYLADPVEAFFAQVQGSVRVRLDDGTQLRLGYADTNGHPYKSIGRVLIDRGELRSDEASMQGIQAWARSHPQQLPELLAQNPGYVFFREMPDFGDGPTGSLGVALTAERSIAVDPKFIPLGAPVFVVTTQPNSDKPLRRLTMAQDTGSAIRGAVRADVYWGSGAQAGESAGRMKQRGELFVLLPR